MGKITAFDQITEMWEVCCEEYEALMFPGAKLGIHFMDPKVGAVPGHFMDPKVGVGPVPGQSSSGLFTSCAFQLVGVAIPGCLPEDWRIYIFISQGKNV